MCIRDRYSTYLYVHKRILERGYQAEIVSGITSFCAVAARLNMGLAEMAEPLHVIPATYKAEEMDEFLKLPGTKVLMKSGKRLKKVRDSILRSGQNAVMIENCGMPEEKIYASAKEIPDVYKRQAFGVLTDVMQTGANDVYCIRTEEHGEVLIPAIKDCILDVDVEAGKMKIHLLDGLI